MTRRGLERIRFLVFVQMTKAGASRDEALTYIDLIHPFDEEDQ